MSQGGIEMKKRVPEPLLLSGKMVPFLYWEYYLIYY